MVVAMFNSADASGTTHATINSDARGRASATRETSETGEGGAP